MIQWHYSRLNYTNSAKENDNPHDCVETDDATDTKAAK